MHLVITNRQPTNAISLNRTCVWGLRLDSVRLSATTNNLPSVIVPKQRQDLFKRFIFRLWHFLVREDPENGKEYRERHERIVLQERLKH